MWPATAPQSLSGAQHDRTDGSQAGRFKVKAAYNAHTWHIRSTDNAWVSENAHDMGKPQGNSMEWDSAYYQFCGH